MKVSNKLHRGTSIAAAVLLLITLILGTAINAASLIVLLSVSKPSQTLTSVLTLGANTFASLLVIIALFRGKKDTLAGVFFILTALPSVVTGVFGNISSAFVYMSRDSLESASMAAGAIVLIFASLINVVFRILMATECFKPGRISGRKTRSLLIILPILYLLLTAVSTVVRQLYLVSYYKAGEFLLLALLPAALSAVLGIGVVILGLAVSIPVYDKNLSCYPFSTQDTYNFT